MDISFSLPKTTSLTISDSKFNQILAANSLNEATKIKNVSDFIDSIMDWFKGGVRRQKIEQLFETIQDVKNTDVSNPESARLEKFIQLRKLVLPKHYNQFKLEITPKDANDDWGYKLKVGNFTLYQCDKIYEKTKNINEREQLADFHVKNICMKLEEALSVENPDTKQLLDFSIRRYSGGSEKNQHSLLKKLDDSGYSKDNFLGVKDSNKPNEFIALFKNDKQLVFSSKTGELGNNFLRNTFAGQNYNNLRELFFSQYTIENEPFFINILQQAKMDFYDPITQDASYLSEQEHAIVNAKLSAIKIGDKTLDRLWGLSLNQPGEYFDDSLTSNPISPLLNDKALREKFYNLGSEFDEPALQFDDSEFEFDKPEVEFADLGLQSDGLESDFDEIMSDKPLFEGSTIDQSTVVLPDSSDESGYESEEDLSVKDYSTNKNLYDLTFINEIDDVK